MNEEKLLIEDTRNLNWNKLFEEAETQGVFPFVYRIVKDTIPYDFTPGYEKKLSYAS
jgi:hypothetical protein